MTTKSFNADQRSGSKPAAPARKAAAKPHASRKQRAAKPTAWGTDLLKKIDALRRALAADA